MSMTDTTNEAPRGGAAANLAALKDRAGKVSGAFDRKQRTVMAAVFAATIGAASFSSTCKRNVDFVSIKYLSKEAYTRFFMLSQLCDDFLKITRPPLQDFYFSIAGAIH